jgi:NADH/F420H2 dehydrogenase subunit C
MNFFKKQKQQVQYAKDLIRILPKLCKKIEVSPTGDLVLWAKSSDSILPLFSFLKNYTLGQYKTLIDITAIDTPQKKERFCLVYQLLSVQYRHRIIVKLELQETDIVIVPSLTPLYNSAGWLEREVWDIYGIFFTNQNDLRRILTDYNFEGYPFRKDFPITGYVEVRYDDEQKRVIYEPLELTQNFRQFNFISSWDWK